MKPLSLDLRERIMSALKETSSSLIVGEQFQVSASFVRKLRLIAARTGSIGPLKHPGRERLVADRDEETLRELVREHPDATLNTLRDMLAARGGPAISETTMWRQLNRMGITLKKKTVHASEQDRADVIAARKTFWLRRWLWRSSRLVFVDESGVNLSLTRAEGRAPRGERVVDDVPGRRWETYTIIAGLRDTGVIAPMVLPGAMNTDALRTWVEESLAPELNRGDIVVWDNLGIHGCPEVAKLIQERGARLEFLPAYSPDLNPIEMAWSKMKAILRRLKARTKEALVDAVGFALKEIGADDCAGWFNHAGYTFL